MPRGHDHRPAATLVSAPSPTPHSPRSSHFVRVISLTDGRVCYLQPARAKKPLGPGEAIAIASVRGQPRFTVILPERWGEANENDLRQRVERRMGTSAPPIAADRSEGRGRNAAPAPRTGLFSRAPFRAQA
jgi:hypothetical protein